MRWRKKRGNFETSQFFDSIDSFSYCLCSNREGLIILYFAILINRFRKFTVSRKITNMNSYLALLFNFDRLQGFLVKLQYTKVSELLVRNAVFYYGIKILQPITIQNIHRWLINRFSISHWKSLLLKKSWNIALNFEKWHQNVLYVKLFSVIDKVRSEISPAVSENGLTPVEKHLWPFVKTRLSSRWADLLIYFDNKRVFSFFPVLDMTLKGFKV